MTPIPKVFFISGFISFAIGFSLLPIPIEAKMFVGGGILMLIAIFPGWRE